MTPLACSRLAVLLSVLVSSGCAGASRPAARDEERALRLIRPDSIRAHVAFLADDRLEGRGTGTRGYDLAASYVAARFRGLGLAPGVGDTSYFQRVPLRRGLVIERECSLALVPEGGPEHPLACGEDFVMAADLLRASHSVTAPLVFAGHGVTAPELGWDDYAGLDVRGRVVVLLTGAPRRFPNDQRAYYSWNAGKERNAATHGARGILNVRTPVDEARTAWERQVRQSRLPAMRWTLEDGAPHDVFAGLEITATLNRPAAAALFAGTPHSLDRVFALADSDRTPRMALPVRIRARRVTALSPASSSNVVGMLRGSDPALRDEVVVVTAHLDHLGISTPVNGDSINNGACDNASGIALMIESARALASLPGKPGRSILFVAVCGEEKGLQGSDYFVHHPTVPIGRIVADINLDMFRMLFPLRDIVAHGREHSSLGPAVERAARRLGLTVSPDPAPEEVVFIRSDQFSFIRAGVPSVFPGAGDPGSPAAREQVRRWMRVIYHTPQDDMNQAFVWDAGVRFARFCVVLAGDVANAPQRPSWNPGDFFGARFGKQH
jgi:hypothetical protein